MLEFHKALERYHQILLDQARVLELTQIACNRLNVMMDEYTERRPTQSMTVADYTIFIQRIFTYLYDIKVLLPYITELNDEIIPSFRLAIEKLNSPEMREQRLSRIELLYRTQDVLSNMIELRTNVLEILCQLSKDFNYFPNIHHAIEMCLQSNSNIERLMRPWLQCENIYRDRIDVLEEVSPILDQIYGRTGTLLAASASS